MDRYMLAQHIPKNEPDNPIRELVFQYFKPTVGCGLLLECYNDLAG